jgi:DegV family protein with EDD domain
MTTDAAVPLTELDGRNLYYTFIAGAKKVIEHQAELNSINVFPINDGDTGTNLAATIRSVMETLHPHRSYKITADRIAEATLMSARGNSGIIFAQFFYGLSNETGELKTVSLKQFAESVKKAVRYIYEAVANPVEGTMLTVIREWADYIFESHGRFSDFNELFISAYEILKKSLLETKTKLAILAKNNVVDAGAKGFVCFIEGIIEFINKKNIKEIILARAENASFGKIEEAIHENIRFRYCTEAILKKCRTENRDLIEILEGYGDSVVVAGSEKIKRFHVHTNSPAQLFEELRNTGIITFQKADDMIRQSQTVYNRKWNIALVTDSTCDLDPELLERYQVNMVPINIHFGENHYLDKVTIQPEQFYSLLDESPDYPRSSQINEKTFTSLFSHLVSYYDSVIAVHLSDKLSGTFFSSQKAAQAISREFGKTVTVLNSKSISGSLGLIILRLALAIEAGHTHDQIIASAERWIKEQSVLVSVRTLKFLVRGGRVSAVKGFLARILNVNPIVTIDDTGKAIVFDKAFSQKANMEKVMGHIKRRCREKTIWNYVVLHANNDAGAKWYSEKMKKLTGKEPVSVVNISPVIGVHVGTGAVAVAMLYE